MNNIRAKFEEIWPVPDNVFWSNAQGKYCAEYARDYLISYARKHNEYLDVFTRCQETMAPVMSIIDEMIADIEYLNNDAYGSMQCPSQELIDRAKQLLGAKE